MVSTYVKLPFGKTKHFVRFCRDRLIFLFYLLAKYNMIVLHYLTTIISWSHRSIKQLTVFWSRNPQKESRHLSIAVLFQVFDCSVTIFFFQKKLFFPIQSTFKKKKLVPPVPPQILQEGGTCPPLATRMNSHVLSSTIFLSAISAFLSYVPRRWQLSDNGSILLCFILF